MVTSSKDRKNKYKAKIDGDVIGGRYEATKKLAIHKQTSYFKDAAELENKVKIACDGAPSINQHFYIAFAEEMAKTPTAAERSIIFTKWAMRGLSWYYLLQVAMKLFGDVPELAGVGVNPPTAAYYSFHAGQGNTAFDFSGNNNHGTITGASWVSGKVGNCLDYNGLTDFTDCGNKASLNVGTNDFTIIAWINYTNFSAIDTIVGKRDNNILTNKGYQMMISNKLVGIICDGSADRISVESIKSINDGNWHMVGIVFDRDDTMRLYIDGEFDSSIDITPQQLSINNTKKFVIGGTDPPGFYMEGKIDEIIMFPRTLLAEEMRTYYNITK